CTHYYGSSLFAYW
nr:immunoglobulin heavy chain junction region [Mus musculus]